MSKHSLSPTGLVSACCVTSVILNQRWRFLQVTLPLRADAANIPSLHTPSRSRSYRFSLSRWLGCSLCRAREVSWLCRFWPVMVTPSWFRSMQNPFLVPSAMGVAKTCCRQAQAVQRQFRYHEWESRQKWRSVRSFAWRTRQWSWEGMSGSLLKRFVAANAKQNQQGNARCGCFWVFVLAFELVWQPWQGSQQQAVAHMRSFYGYASHAR